MKTFIVMIMTAIISSSSLSRVFHRVLARRFPPINSIFVCAVDTEPITKIPRSRVQRYQHHDYSSAAYASLSGGYKLKKIQPAFVSLDSQLKFATKSLSNKSEDDEDYDFDLLVVGAGSGGIASARRAGRPHHSCFGHVVSCIITHYHVLTPIF